MNKLRQVGVIVAARMSSNRLPGKATKELLGIPMLSFLFKRLKSGDAEYEIILATSENEEDDVLEDLAVAEGVSVYRGDLNNVVQRYIRAANNNNIETVVRVTADCPFADPEYADKIVKKFKEMIKNL